MTNAISFLGLLALLLPFRGNADLQFEQKKPPPCSQDHNEFCRKEKVQTKGYFDCMQRHLDKLQPECRVQIKQVTDKLSSAKEEARKTRELCSDDFFKLCQGTPLEDNERRACLTRHKRQLSDACRDALFPAEKKKSAEEKPDDAKPAGAAE